MAARTLALGLLLVGCASHAEPVIERGDAERRARDFVWVERFAADADPPQVSWSYELCPGMEQTSVIVRGVCYSGIFYPTLWRADVAWRGAYSRSAYSHELMHAWQATRGIHDPMHLSEEWMMVPEIDAALAQLGL